MLAFMLNPKKTRKKGSARKARKKGGKGSPWAKCMRAAGGNAKIASGLLRKHKGCRLPKATRKTLSRKVGKGYRARAKSAAIRAGAVRAERKGVTRAARRLRALRLQEEAREREMSSALALNPKKKRSKKKRKKGRKAPMQRVKKGKKLKVGRKTLKGGALTRKKVKGKTRASRRTAACGWSNNPKGKKRKGKRKGRRRNPMGLFSRGSGLLAKIQKALTSTDTYLKFAAGSIGGVVSIAAGNYAAQKLRELTGQDKEDSALSKKSSAGMALDVAFQIAAGIAIGSYLPKKWGEPFMFGAGVSALASSTKTAMKMVVTDPETQKKLGLSGWIPIGGPRQAGSGSLAGSPDSLAGWISVQDARSMRSLRGVPVG